MGEKKNYQLSTSMNEGILEIIYSGKITRDNMDDLYTDLFTIIKEKKPRAMLNDIRALEELYDAFAEAFFRARSVPQGLIIPPSAVVDTSENKDFQSFVEITQANVGRSIKWFDDMEAARAWLKSKL